MTTERRYRITLKGRTYEVEVGDVSSSPVTVKVDGVPYEVEIPSRPQRSALTSAAPLAIEAPAAPERPPARVAAPPPQSPTPLPRPTSVPAPASTGGQTGVDAVVRALMPGRVLRVNVAAGEVVARGHSLIVMESMKMEQTVAAPKDGRIRSVYVKGGDTVQRGQSLVELE